MHWCRPGSRSTAARVIARGERLVADVDAAGGVPLAARLAMGVFDKLLAASPTRGRRGWQLYATATTPAVP